VAGVDGVDHRSFPTARSVAGAQVASGEFNEGVEGASPVDPDVHGVEPLGGADLVEQVTDTGLQSASGVDNTPGFGVEGVDLPRITAIPVSREIVRRRFG
jgi:hypothetical protein